MLAGFETLVDAGYQPESAYFECLHELKLIVDLMYEQGIAGMRYSISDTAEYGDLTRGPRVISDAVRAEMGRILAEIRDGRFAEEWIAENRNGRPNFNELRKVGQAHQIEKVGEELRGMMPFISPGSPAGPGRLGRLIARPGRRRSGPSATVTTQICLFRGVNVGGKNRVAIRDLVALFESLGLREVRTYIQSGNVVFSSDRPASADRLAAAIAQRFGLAAAVVVRSGRQLTRVLTSNPFAGAPPETLHVGFVGQRPAASLVRTLDRAACVPEEFAVAGTEIYLRLPNGMGQAKLPSYLERRLGVGITFRNWRTVTVLADLASAS